MHSIGILKQAKKIKSHNFNGKEEIINSNWKLYTYTSHEDDFYTANGVSPTTTPISNLNGFYFFCRTHSI